MSASCLELASGPGKALALELRSLGPTSGFGRGVVTLCWSVREKVVIVAAFLKLLIVAKRS